MRFDNPLGVGVRDGRKLIVGKVLDVAGLKSNPLYIIGLKDGSIQRCPAWMIREVIPKDNASSDQPLDFTVSVQVGFQFTVELESRVVFQRIYEETYLSIAMDAFIQDGGMIGTGSILKIQEIG